MSGTTRWKNCLEKGRVGEDIVCLGFRMMGYDIHRIGIEHTESVHGYEVINSIKTDPLFTQLRKVPDFLISDGTTHHFLEVKFRSNKDAHTSDEFILDLAKRYLGEEINPPKESAQDYHKFSARKAQQYFNMFKNVNLLLLTPFSANISKLDNFFSIKTVKKTIPPSKEMTVIGYESKIRHDWKESWGKENCLREDISWIQNNFYDHLCKETLPAWMEKFK
jgi:hypothetical protein